MLHHSFSGLYLLTLNVCSHDLKKTLVAIRRNGEEIASVYDQGNDSIGKTLHEYCVLGKSLLGEKVN